jgi:hypothetical protein
MAYRLALTCAVGPFVGPWIRSVGTEYAIEVDGVAELLVEKSDSSIMTLQLTAQRHDFPEGVTKYRLILDNAQTKPVSARVYLK